MVVTATVNGTVLNTLGGLSTTLTNPHVIAIHDVPYTHGLDLVTVVQGVGVGVGLDGDIGDWFVEVGVKGADERFEVTLDISEVPVVEAGGLAVVAGVAGGDPPPALSDPERVFKKVAIPAPKLLFF